MTTMVAMPSRRWGRQEVNLLCLLWLTGLTGCQGFAPGPSRQLSTTASALKSTAAPEEPLIIAEESNFWFTRVQKQTDDSGDGWKAPFVPNLDAEGPLPTECYRRLGRSENDAKPTCFATVRLEHDDSHYGSGNENNRDVRRSPRTVNQSNSFSSDEDDQAVVSVMQRCIDNGLTTFEGPVASYRRLLSATPKSVTEKCNLIVSFPVPTSITGSPFTTLRASVLQSLHESGAEALDTVRIDCESGR